MRQMRQPGASGLGPRAAGGGVHRDRALEKFDEAIELILPCRCRQAVDRSRRAARPAPPRELTKSSKMTRSLSQDRFARTDIIGRSASAAKLSDSRIEIAPRDCASDPQPGPPVPRAGTGRTRQPESALHRATLRREVRRYSFHRPGRRRRRARCPSRRRVPPSSLRICAQNSKRRSDATISAESRCSGKKPKC